MSDLMEINPADNAVIDQLIDAINRRYGLDLSNYARPSLTRRIQRAREQARASDLSDLLDRLVTDESSFDAFLRTVSITVTEWFRDPSFFKSLRDHVVPLLRSYPFLKIWHAGCATGEEAYSMAILLHEAGLLDRAKIYATDFNPHALAKARDGVYAARTVLAQSENYALSGGDGALLDHFTLGYDFAKIRGVLQDSVTFSYHNLVADGAFGDMNLICCRNVLIYFDRHLQNRVLAKFSGSLPHDGLLCLGSKESLNFTAINDSFVALDKKNRIYAKDDRPSNIKERGHAF